MNQQHRFIFWGVLLIVVLLSVSSITFPIFVAQTVKNQNVICIADVRRVTFGKFSFSFNSCVIEIIYTQHRIFIDDFIPFFHSASSIIKRLSFSYILYL